jgi:hypothetical protein
MYTNTNPVESYVHKYKSCWKLCTQLQILHLSMYTNTNIALNYAYKYKYCNKSSTKMQILYNIRANMTWRQKVSKELVFKNSF